MCRTCLLDFLLVNLAHKTALDITEFTYKT